MSIITAIEPQRRPGRFSIYLDGDFSIGVDEHVIADLHLHKDQQIDESDLRQLALAEEKRRALASCLRLLARRPYATKELVDKLTQRGYEPQTITAVTDRLTELELVDDKQFAAAWVESRTRVQHDGPLKLRLDLKQRGVSKNLVAEAVQNVDADAELALAREAIGRRAQRITGDKTERKKEYKRLADFLTRRGFGWEATRKALAEVFSPDLEPDE